RGRLLTARGAQLLEHPLAGGDGEGPRSQLRLCSAHRKVDGRYLSPWLAELDGETADAAEEEHIDVEVALGLDHDAMRLDPYSPVAPR
ncbi:MAG: hypothetical protein JWR63_3202, partial [Conexibacter sp.]|nr:hypothetical protein [Conexibacter sp.]